MAFTAHAVHRANASLVGSAVNKSAPISIDGMRERLFSLMFSRLVYPQIWEDPVIDLAALQLQPSSRIITIASGGCNFMSYATGAPASVTVVDLNAAHVALGQLKLTAARELPFHLFYALFGKADRASNVAVIDEMLMPHLDAQTAAYWNGRDRLGRRRCTAFARGFYRHGLLGNFIGASHLLAKIHGVDPSKLLEARSLEEQQEFFRRELEPLLDKPLVRWLVARPQALFGLGIPPAQYVSLAGDHRSGIVEVLRQRLEKLACAFPLSQNYFAQQAFGRSYGVSPDRSLPPYLEQSNFAALSANVDKITIRQQSFTDTLREAPAGSFDRYVLLDAQDWMSDVELTALWQEITRTSSPGTRVIFRTAAAPSLLPGRLPEALLSQWHYEAETSHRLSQQDRSAIYGGFHLYSRVH